jgi:hypothetical protein
MVRPSPRRSFLREESGISLAEGMIVMPIVLLVFAAFVEFGYAMFQWNQAVKALQYGARLAAVSDPVAADFDPMAAVAAPTVAQVGATIPIGGSWTCSGDDPDNCTDDGALNRIVYGSAGATQCGDIDSAGVRPAMCHLDPWIELENVVVTYELSGLGYYSRPGGAVVTIRMSVQDLTFDLPIIGALIGLTNVTVPAMPVTVTSEDLSTTTS